MTPILLALALLGAAPGLPAEPELPVCDAVHAPLGPSLKARRRHRLLAKRVQSRFGDGRRSYVKGHLHAGLDLAADPSEAVFAICEGTVVDEHLGFPHRTLVVQHRLADGSTLYSSYKHITDVAVKVGEHVGPGTRLARVFTDKEQHRTGWRRLHLHFELRRRIDDEGSASWTSMTRAALERYAMDPAPFFKARLFKAGLSGRAQSRRSQTGSSAHR